MKRQMMNQTGGLENGRDGWKGSQRVNGESLSEVVKARVGTEPVCSGSRAAPETLDIVGHPPRCVFDTHTAVAPIQLWRPCSGPLGLPASPLTELVEGCGGSSGMGAVRSRKERGKEAGLDMVAEADAGEEEKAELQRPQGRQPMDSLPGCPKRRKGCDPLGSGWELAKRGDLHLNTSHFKKSFCLHIPSSFLRDL